MTALLAGTVAATLLAGGLAAFTWQHRERPGGRYFTAMMAVNALWLLGFAVELTATDVSTALSLFQLRSAVIAFVPALWTLFTLDYADYGDRVTPSVVVAIVVPAVVTAALSFTNPIHGLFWSDPALVTEGPYRLLVVEYTVGWWASVAISYLLVTAGMVLVASIAVQSTGLYRRQSLLVLGASVAPTLANVAYQTRVSPVPYLDLTPFGFVVNGVVVFWALYDYRLFDISPVARSAVVDRMDDPMVAVDGSEHVVDVNPAALDLSAVADPLGRQFPEAFPEVAAAVDLDADAMTDEVAFDAGADARYFEPRLTPLGDRQGAVIVLRDVTRRRSRERGGTSTPAARDSTFGPTPRYGPTAAASRNCSRTSFATRSNTVRPTPTLMLVGTPWNTVPRAVGRRPTTRSNTARQASPPDPLATTYSTLPPRTMSGQERPRTPCRRRARPGATALSATRCFRSPSAVCRRMRVPTTRRRRGSPAAPSGSTSRTTDRGSRRGTGTRSSSGGTPRRSRGRASASRSSARSRRLTAGRCPRRRATPAALASRSPASPSSDQANSIASRSRTSPNSHSAWSSAYARWSSSMNPTASSARIGR